MEKIAERIKLIRKENKMNQQEFAKILGLSQTHISKIENGKDRPSDKVLSIVSVEFRINLDWLKTGQGDVHDFSGHENRDIELKDCTLLLKKYLQSCSDSEFLFCSKYVFEIPELFQCSNFLSKYGLGGGKINALLGLDSMLTVLTDYVGFMNREVTDIVASKATLEELQPKFQLINEVRERYKGKMAGSMDKFFECFIEQRVEQRVEHRIEIQN